MPQFRKLGLKNFKTSNFTLIWNYFLIMLFLLASKIYQPAARNFVGQCSEICEFKKKIMLLSLEHSYS